MDPLYGGVCAALRGATGPVLDLGCGIGLLAHALRGQGSTLEYVGVDSDSGKVATARASMERTPFHAPLVADPSNAVGRVTFRVCDLAYDFPPWHGNVVLLDLLQYLPPARQWPLLDAVASCLWPDSRLIIRTGLHSAGWRSRVTRLADRLGHAARWMNTAPRRYPRREELLRFLASRGLSHRIEPMRGGMPFDNWLIVASRGGVAAVPAEPD